jgi:CPA1 family monovalent cation:H+ antiporter
VVLGTLVLQGFTLRPLLAFLDLRDDGSVERELSHARVRALEAAMDTLKADTSPQASAIRREYEETLSRAACTEDGRIPDRLAGDRSRRKAIDAARKALLELRARGEIGDDAFHRVEEDLDLLELSAGGRNVA